MQLLEKTAFNCFPPSIRLQVEIVQSPRKVVEDKLPEATILQEYAATSSGRRFLDRQSHRGDYANHASLMDLRSCARSLYNRTNLSDQVSITINHIFGNEKRFGYSDAPPPVRYYHVGLTPLLEALPKAERMNDGEVIGRSCDVFHFKSVGEGTHSQSLVYSLDKATGVPLRVAAYRNPDKVRENVPNWVWSAPTLDQVGKRHIPKSSTLSYFMSVKADNGEQVNKLDILQSIRVVNVEYDLALPASTFWPVFQPGVVVTDEIKRTTVTVPGGPATPKPTVPQTGAAIRVPQSDNSDLMSAAFGIALSLGVLAVAMLLWQRSRSS